MPATPVWLAAVESVLNRSIGRSQQAEAAAHRLDRTSLMLEIEGIARIRVAVGAGRLALCAGAEPGTDAAVSRPDAVISGTPIALLKLTTDNAGRTAGSASDRPPRAAARVAGDAEIAARYRELLALARPDLEEELSQLIGDLPARRLSMAAQAVLAWTRKLHRTAGRNLAEYLQEESRDLIAKPEIEEFVENVDRLRETADRIEARLARIEQRLKAAT